jgi:phosphotransferase system IIA component|tara:strand:- start:937 stop:1239 length:303 start_codon:yes stop_codon:yes gene_type:complete
MDIQQMVSELGVPIAVSLAMMWGCFYLIKYITGQHTVLMNQKFQNLTEINIKLIDQQKLMQLDLKALESNVATLVSFIIEERDKEKDRLVQKLKDKNGFK